jgi:predicted dehydrogenase
MASSPVRLGVIGAGRIAQAAHLPAAVKAEGVELAAVCDPSEYISKRVADAYGIAGYTDADEFFRHDLHAIIVAAPDRLHLPLAAKALEAGKHVLVEKPLAATVTQARQLVDLAAEKGLKIQVGSMKRHDPGIEFAKAALPKIGRILSARTWYRVMSDLRADTEATLFPPIIMDPEVRAAENVFKAAREHYLLVTHGAHVFDGIRYLAGEVSRLSTRVGCTGDDYTWHGTGRLTPDAGLISFEISASVHAQWSEGFEIFGENGSITINTHFPFFRRASDVSVYIEKGAAATVPAFGDQNAFERQLEAFARSIADDTDTMPNGLDGLAAVRFIEAVAESAAADGKEVAL